MDLLLERKKQQANRWMEQFVHSILPFYQNMRHQDVVRIPDENAMKRLQEMEIPKEGRDAVEVLEEMVNQIYSQTSLVQHPRCFACVPSPVSIFSWMGDVMTNAFDPHGGSVMNAPGPAMAEQKTIGWMCSLAGYPKEAGGLFVSGGSMANLTAMTAARDQKLTWEERERAVAYVSDQTHSSVAKGLHIIGFREEQIRKVPVDDDFRMRAELLENDIKEDQEAGKKPFLVVATAGTTNTGSVDPLPQIGDICEKYGLWMHVDGAYGASLLVSEKQRGLLKGIERSDSLSWDAHKWLMQTYGCSAVLVRDQKCLLNSFSVHPEYLKDEEAKDGQVNFWDLGPELTRPSRGVKLWLTLQVMGERAMGEAIDYGCGLAQTAEKLICSLPGWEIVSPAKQAVVNFRYKPEGMAEKEADAVNQEISEKLTESGYGEVLTTELNGKKVLRMCTLNSDTTKEDIRSTIHLLDRFAKEQKKAKTA